MTVRWEARRPALRATGHDDRAGDRERGVARSASQEETIPRPRPFAPFALSIAVLAVAMACQERAPERMPLPGPDGRQEALLLASAKVALPPPADPATDLPDPTSEGARLVTRYCTACHEIPTPRIHSPTDWPRVARRMWLRMEGLPTGMDVPRPTGAERTVMLRYLVGNALRVSGAALPEGAGRTEFVAVCSRCHELPDPRFATSEGWPAVVARMQELMVSMLGAGMADAQQVAIADYLATAAAPR